ncbi:MAG: hypothetical protein HY680_05795 [Chloroflexi bacterium]|nr:hypothetical protein [Chloroflexota bacterium]
MATLALAMLLAWALSLLAYSVGAVDAPLVQAEVLDISLGSLVANPGDPVRVEAKVRNPGEAEAQLNVVVYLDEAPVGARVITLPSGAVQTLRFSVMSEQPGAHVVRIGPQAATYQVLAPEIRLRGLTVSPGLVAPGELVRVSAAAANVGPVPGVYQAPLMVNNTVVDARSDLLPVGGEAAIVFTVARKDPGVYAVQVGDLLGGFIVVGRDMDVAVPASLPIVPARATALSTGGTPLPVTGGVVTLLGTQGLPQVALPLRLAPGEGLGSFQEPVSGVTYENGLLSLPVKDELNRTAARLELAPEGWSTTGDAALMTPRSLRLVVPDTLLRLPLSVTAAAPVTLSMESALASLELGKPLRIVPGLEPAAPGRAALEAAAQGQGKRVREVIAAASVEAPGAPPEGLRAGTAVAFGVPAVWLSTVEEKALYAARIAPSGAVELSPVVLALAQPGRASLRASFASPHGAFFLLALEPAVKPIASRMELSATLVPVDGALTVRAYGDGAGAEGEALGNLVLTLDGQPMAIAQASAMADGGWEAVYYVAVAEAGSHELAVGEARAQFEAAPRDLVGHVQVVSIDASPKSVLPGQPVEVRATLANVGTRRLLTPALLEVNGAPSEERLVALDPGERAGLSFALMKAREGSYEVALLGRRARFNVAAQPKPGEVYASDLVVEPSSVDVGQPAQARLLLSNGGELPAAHTLRVFLNGREVHRREITLAGLTTMPAVVPLQPVDQGILTVEVEGMRRQIVVISPLQKADLVVMRLDLDPATISGGQKMTATVEIRNRLAEQTSSTLYVLVNGRLVAQADLDVLPQATVQRQFVLTEEVPGLYEVEMRLGRSAESVVSIYKGQFLVILAQTPPSWEIASLEVLPRPASPGEPLQVSFLLSNLGQQGGDLEVVVRVDGQIESQRTVSLGPQSTRPVSFSLPGKPAGTYLLDVNGTTVQFQVPPLPTATPPLPTPTPAAATQGGSEGPGILWVIAGAVALAAGALATYLLRDRRPRSP